MCVNVKPTSKLKILYSKSTIRLAYITPAVNLLALNKTGEKNYSMISAVHRLLSILRFITRLLHGIKVH